MHIHNLLSSLGSIWYSDALLHIWSRHYSLQPLSFNYLNTTQKLDATFSYNKTN